MRERAPLRTTERAPLGSAVDAEALGIRDAATITGPGSCADTLLPFV
jgi:hypothetical protein